MAVILLVTHEFKIIAEHNKMLQEARALLAYYVRNFLLNIVGNDRESGMIVNL